MFCSNQDREATEKKRQIWEWKSKAKRSVFYLCLWLSSHLLGAITMNPTNEQRIRDFIIPHRQNAGDPKWLLQTNAPRDSPS